MDSEEALSGPPMVPSSLKLGISLPLPLGKLRESQITLNGTRKQVMALRGSMFGDYLLGGLREAQRRTMILKELSCT